MVTQTVDNECQTLLSRLLDARAKTDALFRIVDPEAMYDRPIPERHRIVFYVGHLEAFDWNLLGGPGDVAGAHPAFHRLFAFGIDPVGGDLPTDGPEDWPRLPEVNDYRDRVRHALDRILTATVQPERDGSLTQLLNVAIEHRLMHAETLAYILHQMPLERKKRLTVRCPLEGSPLAPGSVRIPAGHATLGLKRDSLAFGWDNEFEEHTVTVPEFSIDRYKVTNGQFLEFLKDGGYSNRALWASADWGWRTAQDISHPALWVPRGETWSYRSMFDEFPLPFDWPVYVSHAEASAYAHWAGKALPTEAEWQRAAYGHGKRAEEQSASGRVHLPPDTWNPVPVTASMAGRNRFGVEGLIANGWEWTSTEFAPLPGFQPFTFYPGYSAPFFDGKHYVLKGGSVRTAPCMLRGSFRNWFQPHYQYVYAGFRCVSGNDSAVTVK